MKVIRPNCRAHFTPADYEFIGSTLPDSGAKSQWLFQLLEDPDSLDIILDNPRIFRSVLDLKSCLSVSLHFYFYVLVRHVLLREDIQDREVADYVAEVLAEFASHQRWRHPDASEPRPMDYLHEMLAALDRADDDKRFIILTHIGNYSLFLSGIFPQHLLFRAERRAAPGFSFYEELGSAHFRMAGEHYLARKLAMAPVLITLGQVFRMIRMALNHLSERLVFLETHGAVQELFREIDSAGSPPAP
jgi:hypothetical protein